MALLFNCGFAALLDEWKCQSKLKCYFKKNHCNLETIQTLKTPVMLRALKNGITVGI